MCGAEVQKGNPPTERKLQRLFRRPEVSSLIKKCNDFGAGGVSVAIGELADGLKIDLDSVPKKYAGLDGTEIAISESQERMAVVVDPKDVDKMLAFALHIVVLHMIPGGKSSWHGEQELRRLLVPILNEASVDIMLCGHYHRYQWIDDGSRGTNFPILVNSNRDKLVVKADRRGIDIDVVNTGGEVIKRHRIDK